MRKNLIYFMVIVLITMGMSACFSEPQAEKKQSTSDGIVHIKWWSFPVFSQENASDSEGTYERKLIHEFEKRNPDIRVHLKMIDFTTGPEKLNKSIANDSAPDVLFDAPGRIAAYGKDGYMLPLNDLFTDEWIQDVNNDELIQACKMEQVPYVYPISSAPFYMAFNKKMLEASGVLSLVREGWTTNDFESVITALKEHGYVPGSLYCKDSSGDQGTRAFVNNLYSNSFVNPNNKKFSLSEGNGLKAIAFLSDAINQGTLLRGLYRNGSDEIDSFVSGRSSYTLLWGPVQQMNNEENLSRNNIEVVEVPFPSNNGKPELEYLINGFGIFNHHDNKRAQASEKLIRFICDDEVFGPQDVIRTSCIPVRNSYGDLYQNERMKKIANWTKYYSDYYNTNENFAQMRVAWFQNLQQFLCQSEDPKEMVQRFNFAANEKEDVQ